MLRDELTSDVAGIILEYLRSVKGRSDDTRTDAQKASMFALLKELTAEYPDARIMGHCELPHVAKDCPCFIPSTYYSSLQPSNRK